MLFFVPVNYTFVVDLFLQSTVLFTEELEGI